MKKLFVAAALVMGLGTSAAFADNFMVDSVTVTMINDFTPIEVKDLPAAVQEAITKNYAESTIKEAAVEANEDGTKTYKVVLTDEEGTESTVLFLRVPVQSTGSFPSTQGERTVPSEHAGKYCHPDWNVESHISNHL